MDSCGRSVQLWLHHGRALHGDAAVSVLELAWGTPSAHREDPRHIPYVACAFRSDVVRLFRPSSHRPRNVCGSSCGHVEEGHRNSVTPGMFYCDSVEQNLSLIIKQDRIYDCEVFEICTRLLQHNPHDRGRISDYSAMGFFAGLAGDFVPGRQHWISV